MTLVEVLSDATRAKAVVADSERLLEAEVAAKRGLSGAAIRAGFRTMRKIRPGIIPHALRVLLPQFAPAIDPHFARGRATGDTRTHFARNADGIADDLLAVTDGRLAQAQNRVLIKVYRALRPQARKHVAQAMPAVADLCDKHVPA